MRGQKPHRGRRGAISKDEHRDSPDWREFEKRIARIERALGPAKAQVKSPDKLLNKATGTLQEVDASFRTTVGTMPFLAIVECRKRSRNEDIQWIQQLAAKGKDLGADKVIAVSSKGFSPAAQTAARAHSIELRKLSELSANAALAWAIGEDAYRTEQWIEV